MAASRAYSSLQAQLTPVVNTATQAHSAGRTRDAADAYDAALRVLDAGLDVAARDLAPPELRGLQQYRQQLAALVQSLRQQLATPPPQGATHADPAATVDDMGLDLDAFAADLGGDDFDAIAAGGTEAKPTRRRVIQTSAPRVHVPPRVVPARPAPTGASNSAALGGRLPDDAPAAPPPPKAKSESKGGGGGDGGGASVPGGPPKIDFGGLSKPTAGQSATGSRKNYAARASDLVYKSLEVATVLVKRGDLKRAVDMLQHAVDESAREENVPANVRTVEDMCRQLREKLLASQPPRRVQDNEVLPAEAEVLRRAGTTSRILLPSWDDPVEGFASENLFYPCRGLFTDDWTPQLDPKQAELGAVFDRIRPVPDPDAPKPAGTPPTTSGATDSPKPDGGDAQPSDGANPAAKPEEGAAGDKDDSKKTGADDSPKPQGDSGGGGGAADDPVAEFDKISREEADAEAEKQKKQQPAAADQAPKLPPALLYVSRGQMDPARIRQTVVGDCSFVCSLIVCAQIQQRFPTVRLITSSIYPQAMDGSPVLSRSGKYAVKMLMNGTTRLIVVDDRLPVRPDGADGKSKFGSAAAPLSNANPPVAVSVDDDELGAEFDAVMNPGPVGNASRDDTKALEQRWLPRKRPAQLLCSFSSDPNELWVSLLEKAFIKVCGGSYDWPGSASSSDLYMLSAWLPDAVDLPGRGDGQAKDFDGEYQWRRLAACHPRGAVAATLNTPQQLPDALKGRLGLAEAHAYAVLDVREHGGQRLVKVKNPWARGGAWKGLYSLADTENWTPELLQALQYTEDEAKGGIFWIRWRDLCICFATLHLSWNPFMLYPGPGGRATKPTRLAAHARFDFAESNLLLPQFQVRVSAEVPQGMSRRLHVVLARHVTDHREFRENLARTGLLVERPYLTVHIYDVTSLPSAAALRLGSLAAHTNDDAGNCYGRRVQGREIPEGCLVHRGIYRNTAFQTISFNAGQSGYREYSVVVSQHMPEESLAKGTKPQPFTFSITVHSAIPQGPRGIQLRQIPYRTLGHGAAVAGQWAKGGSCGGRLGLATYGFNPQYTFTLSQPSRIIASLICTGKQSIAVHVVRRDPNAPKQHATVTETPWEARVDNTGFSEYVDVINGNKGVYCRHDSVADSTLAKCVEKTSAHGHVSDPSLPAPPPPAGPPPEDIAGPPAPAPAPHRPKGLLRLVLPPPQGASGGPQEVSVPIGVRWPQLDKRAARNLFCLAALGNGRLAAPKLATVIIRGRQLDGSQPLDQALAALDGINFWGAADSPPPVVVNVGTDELSRSGDLAKLEPSVFAVAKSALELLASQSPDNDVGARKRAAAGAEETATQLLMRIDACSAPTEAIGLCRRAFVEAVQLVHDVIDAIVEPVAGAAPAPPPGAPPAAVVDPIPSSDELIAAGGGVMPAGTYTVIASAWTKGDPGVFRLSLEAEEDVSLAPVPFEGADWHPVSITGLTWPSSEALIAVKKGCSIFVRLMYVGADGAAADDKPVPLRCAIAEAGTGRAIVETAWTVCCRLPAVRLDGGAKYKIVAKGDANAAANGKFVVRCFTSAADAVTPVSS